MSEKTNVYKAPNLFCVTVELAAIKINTLRVIKLSLRVRLVLSLTLISCLYALINNIALTIIKMAL